MAITVEHPGAHYASPEQLDEAGVDLEQVKGYRNESGVATVYIFEGEELDQVLAADEGEVQVEEPVAKTSSRKRTADISEPSVSAEGSVQS